MPRKRSTASRLRALGAFVLLAAIAGGWGWWQLRHWRPDKSEFAFQGIEVGSRDGAVNWKAAKAIGASFVYLDASASAFARDPLFVQNLADARAAKLQVGAVHIYDPCQPADKQSANFVTVVPRDASLLPPAVELDLTAEKCPIPVSDAAVLSELMTFLNQIETHTGKSTILKISPAFEKRYRLAAKLDRNLWLERNRFAPDYAGRPWIMWTANSSFDTPAADEPLRWVVVDK